MTEPTIVPTAALLTLLRDVHRCASDDTTLAMIAGVLLHTSTDERTGKQVLAASATDRFMLMHGAVPASGAPLGRVFLSNEQVRQLTSMLRPYTTRKRTALAETAISIEGDRVSIRQVSLDGLGELATTFAHNEGRTFPRIAKLLQDALDDEPPAEATHVDGGRLAMFARVASVRREPMRLRGGGTKPVTVQIGAELIGLLMPIRSDGSPAVGVHAAPALADDTTPQAAAS